MKTVFTAMKEHLSSSSIDYIEAIDILTREHGHAHTKEIAEHLKVKMPSVTTALQQLSQRGFVEYNSHQPVKLTENGQRIANRVANNHRALETFFQRALGLSPEKAHDVSCSIDHIVDEDMTRRLVVFSRAVSERQDCTSLAAYLTQAMEAINNSADEHHDVIAVLAPRTKCTYEKGPAVVKLSVGEEFVIGERTFDNKSIALIDKSGHRHLVSVKDAWECWCQVIEEGE